MDENFNIYDNSHLINKFNEFQKSKNINFNDINLLFNAFTHSSYANEILQGVENNEKLEFLGDSVLALIVNEYIFDIYKDYTEGDLSRIKSIIVSEYTLAKIARKIDIGDYLLLGKGERQYGGADRDAVLADTMEAILGAYYLDSGLDKVRDFFLPYIKTELDNIDRDSYKKDYKTALQLIIQQKFKSCPIYKTIKEEGPDHEKIFYVNVIIEGKEVCTGKGTNKKNAQQESAKKALKIFKDRKIL